MSRINYGHYPASRHASKCNLLVSGFKDELMCAIVGGSLIWEELSTKLFGIMIDSSLTFDNHVKTICKSASQKLTGISRMSNVMSEIKRKVLIQAFFESQFGYCPLI